MDTSIIIQLFLLPLPILFAGFFAGSETALTSLSGNILDKLKAKHLHRRTLLQFWENFPDKVLATIILGNTLSTVFCGVLAASIGEDLSVKYHVSYQWTIPLISFVVTLLLLTFGEVLPKILGRLFSEKLSPIVIVPLVPLTHIIHPIVKALVYIAGLFVKMLGAEPQKEIPTLTAQDLKGMLTSENPAEFKSSSHRILKNILEFGQQRVKDVQKPLEKVIAIDIRQNPQETIQVFHRSPYSRIVAYKNSIDNIVGVIYSKDLLSTWRTEGLILILDLLRPAYFVSEEMLISDLLREFKKGKHHLAVVQDKNGKVTGIITIEDVIERIVGEIYDESKIQGEAKGK